MKLLYLVVCLLSVFVNSESCKFGRAACVASCMLQNCATGYCPDGENGICHCSRCGTGPVSNGKVSVANKKK